MTETQLCGAARFEREALDQLMKVCTNTWEDVKLMIKLNLNLHNWTHFDFCLCSFLSYHFLSNAQANECSSLLQCIASLDGSTESPYALLFLRANAVKFILKTCHSSKFSLHKTASSSGYVRLTCAAPKIAQSV